MHFWSKQRRCLIAACIPGSVNLPYNTREPGRCTRRAYSGHAPTSANRCTWFVSDVACAGRRVSDGFEQACKVACDNLDAICDKVHFDENDHEQLARVARTTLSSKMSVLAKILIRIVCSTPCLRLVDSCVSCAPSRRIVCPDLPLFHLQRDPLPRPNGGDDCQRGAGGG